MRRDLSTALVALLAVTVVFGLAYPLAVTGIAQGLFPVRADGDPAVIAKAPGGDPGSFHPRPSVTGYAPLGTFFPNLGPNERELAEELARRADAYVARERPYNAGLTRRDVPADAATSSASGVDPHVSIANARIQARRVAQRRGIPLARVLELAGDHAVRPLFGLAGARSVNVVTLNAALDREARR